MNIRLDDLRGPEIRALLEEHLADMRRISPPESVHALDLDRLRRPEISFWTVWEGGELLGCGALKELTRRHGEIKSMRTARAHRGKGVARAVLTHVVAEAERRGYSRLSLETGTQPDFEPARRLYASFGFETTGPFADYVLDPNSTFMTRRLPPPKGGLPLPEPGVAGLTVVELGLEHEALLQRFYDANPYYFVNITGVPAPPEEAREEILGELPADVPYTKKWVLGLLDAHGELAAQWNIASDLLASEVWHVGLFLLATPRHGSGEARAIYEAGERWMARHGARWLRLNVVKGNVHAERFWRGRGYRYLRERDGIVMGPRTNTVMTFVKPLTGTLDEYLERVPRDRPEQG